jgi:hypothetical protein
LWRTTHYFSGIGTIARAGKSRTPASASKLAAQLPYRQAAALLDELLPERGGLNHATTRNRTLAVGKRIEEEIREAIDHPRVVPESAKRIVVGIDGAFVKAGHTRAGQRHQFEILTGRVETSQRGGEAFAVERDLDLYAKRRVQAILRRCGRGEDTDLRILSDDEDGLRGVVGTWFRKKCEHRLGLVPCCTADRANRKGIPVSPLWA